MSRKIQASIAVLVCLLTGCARDEESVDKVVQRSTASQGTVAFAHHSMWLRQNGSVTGRVAVRDSSAGPYIGDDAEMTVGLGVTVDGDVFGDSVRLKDGASIAGDVHGNELVQGSVTIGGSWVTPLTVPLTDLTPAMPSFQAGTEDVTITGQTTLELAAGDYATVKLKQGTQGTPTALRLSGTYNLLTLDMALNSRVECTAACEIRIKDKLVGDQNGYLGPAAGTSLTAKDVKVFVEGVNGSTGTLAATPKRRRSASPTRSARTSTHRTGRCGSARTAWSTACSSAGGSRSGSASMPPRRTRWTRPRPTPARRTRRWTPRFRLRM